MGEGLIQHHLDLAAEEIRRLHHVANATTDSRLVDHGLFDEEDALDLLYSELDPEQLDILSTLREAGVLP